MGLSVTEMVIHGNSVKDQSGAWSATFDSEGELLSFRNERPEHYLTAHVTRGCVPNLWAALVQILTFGKVNLNSIEYHDPVELYDKDPGSPQEFLRKASVAREAALSQIRLVGLNAVRTQVHPGSDSCYIFDRRAGWQIVYSDGRLKGLGRCSGVILAEQTEDFTLVNVRYPPQPCGCSPQTTDVGVNAYPSWAWKSTPRKYVVH